jgi:hypothetical protein
MTTGNLAEVDGERVDRVGVSPSLTTMARNAANTVRGDQVKSKVKWEGQFLLIDSVTEIEGNTFALKDKWTLSEDGKIINWLRRFISPDGEAVASYVMEKQ